MAVVPAWTGIDGRAPRIPPGIESWIARHRPVIAATLAFRPEYRFEWQLAALAALRGEHPSLGLVVMGQGEGAGAARRRVHQQRLEDNVLLLGDVPHSRCLAILSRCDVFLRTTSREGDALSVREALALGIPVVASDVGHRPHGVRLFPADELAGLVRVLRATLDEGADAVVDATEAVASADLDQLLGAYREVSRGGAWMRPAPAVAAGPRGRP
jgi:glycosyltransferase involved in cell wall biosynthesis